MLPLLFASIPPARDAVYVSNPPEFLRRRSPQVVTQRVSDNFPNGDQAHFGFDLAEMPAALRPDVVGDSYCLASFTANVPRSPGEPDP